MTARRWRCALLVALLLVLLSPAPGRAAAGGRSSFKASDFASLAFEQHPGAALPLDIRLRDETGQTVRLGRFFGQVPAILVLEYLRCPNLCGLVLGSLLDALGSVPLRAGRDFQVLAVSIDPREGPSDAAAARKRYAQRSRDAASWHFLTGPQAEVERLAQSVGFPLRYDAAIDQFAHPAGVVLASPAGRISRYILGVGYRPLDLRIGLLDAAAGAVPGPASGLLLLCYGYDPETGRYTLAVTRLLRAGALVTLLALAIPVAWMIRRERKGG